MELRTTIQKTGEFGTLGRAIGGTGWLRFFAAGAWAIGFWAAVSVPAHAAETEFSAQVDRPRVSMDESVSFKLNLRSDGGGSMNNIRFSAPDFEVLNEYSNTFVQSYYENGTFGVRNNHSITKVLKPLRQGTLTISGISVSVNGKVHTAPTIQIQVAPPGSATPPPPGYGGGGVGLRGAGKRNLAKSVFLRAEINKDTVYKGEQVIVSYYLYRRVRVFNIQVDKYPILNGFLREDLELPVLGSRLDSERVMLDGVPYERSLLLRYAAYPLQDGKLKIDSVALKYNYYASNVGMDDEDPMQGMFNMMTPRSGAERSDQVPITVLPLPEEDRPPSFTGGVGDFSLSSAVDKYDVRANEAVTLKVKVEGRGNLASVGEPKVKWPENVELYDSKGKSSSGRAGVGEKVFEFLLIPRTPGKLVLPPIEFSFFDPDKKTFVTRSVEGAQINVGEPAPGSSVVQKPALSQTGSASGTPANGSKTASSEQQLEPLKIQEPSRTAIFQGQPFWRWLYWLSGAAFGTFFLLLAYDLIRRGRARARDAFEKRSKAEARSFERLRTQAAQALNGGSWQETTQAYELLSSLIFEALDQRFGLGARSLPRSELKRILVDERGVPSALWERTGKLLEYAEIVRFAAQAGALSEASAREGLGQWVSEGESLIRSYGELHPESVSSS